MQVSSNQLVIRKCTVPHLFAVTGMTSLQQGLNMTKDSGMTGSTGLIRPPTAAQLIT